MSGLARDPLTGVTVLDLSSVGPAARATRILADYGATIVKVAAPPGRGPAGGPPFYAYGARRGMKRALIDLRDDAGRGAFLEMASRADVVMESFRPGTADRLGIGYEAVRDRNRAIVYCSTTGYGRRGKRSQWAGHDLNYLAVGGYLAMSEPNSRGGPPLPGATVADAAAGGMHAALAVMSSLLRRETTGEGAFLDVSVTDGVLWLMSLVIDEQLAMASEPSPGHDVLSGRYACYGTYQASDGLWLSVAAIEPKFFANLCRALGCEDLIPLQYEDSSQDEIRQELASRFATAARDDWVERLAGSDTCVAPVLSIAEVASDDEFLSSGAYVEAKSALRGNFRQVGALLAGMGELEEPVEVRDDAPRPATDTEALLSEAGFERSELDALRSRGVIG